MRKTIDLRHGDSREVLKTLADNSVDCVVTDPPYHLTSIVKRFGGKNAAPAKSGSDGRFTRLSKGFMGKEWDGGDIAFDPTFWVEVFRVLKPGGHMLAFSGPRTYHRMASAIEAAGFVIRDMVYWVYGQGFPKSHDISKAIDREAGVEREVVGEVKRWGNAAGKGAAGFYANGFEDVPQGLHRTDPITAPATEEAETWDGWGSALKPSQEPICLCQKPLSEKTIAANVLRWGTGALNIDATRIGTAPIKTNGRGSQTGSTPIVPLDPAYQGGTHVGRWPANFMLSHSPDCVLVRTVTVPGYSINRFQDGMKPFGEGAGHEFEQVETPPESLEIWACVHGCPVRILDDQAGIRTSGGSGIIHADNSNVYGSIKNRIGTPIKVYDDSGSASRFFYVSKVSGEERNAGLGKDIKASYWSDGRNKTADFPKQRAKTPRKNSHPCLKPISLLKELVRLICPPGGIVLDPFSGAGSTGCAAVLEEVTGGFIGIELEAEYFEIAKLRIAYWENTTRLPLFELAEAAAGEGGPSLTLAEEPVNVPNTDAPTADRG